MDSISIKKHLKELLKESEKLNFNDNIKEFEKALIGINNDPKKIMEMISSLKAILEINQDNFEQIIQDSNGQSNFLLKCQDSEQDSINLNLLSIKDLFKICKTGDYICDTKNKYLWKISEECEDVGHYYYKIAQPIENKEKYPEFTKAPFEIWEDRQSEYTYYPNLKIL